MLQDLGTMMKFVSLASIVHERWTHLSTCNTTVCVLSRFQRFQCIDQKQNNNTYSYDFAFQLHSNFCIAHSISRVNKWKEYSSRFDVFNHSSNRCWLAFVWIELNYRLFIVQKTSLLQFAIHNDNYPAIIYLSWFH